MYLRYAASGGDDAGEEPRVVVEIGLRRSLPIELAEHGLDDDWRPGREGADAPDDRPEIEGGAAHRPEPRLAARIELRPDLEPLLPGIALEDVAGGGPREARGVRDYHEPGCAEGHGEGPARGGAGVQGGFEEGGEGGLAVSGERDVADRAELVGPVPGKGVEGGNEVGYVEGPFAFEGEDLAVGAVEGAALGVREEVDAEGKAPRTPREDRIEDASGLAAGTVIGVVEGRLPFHGTILAPLGPEPQDRRARTRPGKACIFIHARWMKNRFPDSMST